MEQTLSDFFIILCMEKRSAQNNHCQNWQGSFPKATTVASNVVVQRNLTTTIFFSKKQYEAAQQFQQS